MLLIFKRSDQNDPQNSFLTILTITQGLLSMSISNQGNLGLEVSKKGIIVVGNMNQNIKHIMEEFSLYSLSRANKSLRCVFVKIWQYT